MTYHSDTVVIKNYDSAKDLLVSINGEVATRHRNGWELQDLAVFAVRDKAAVYSARLQFLKKEEAA